MNSKTVTGLVLLFSLVACSFSFSVLCGAGDSDGPPPWCTKAKTKVERLICEGGQLGEFDKELGMYYENLLSIDEPNAKSELVQSQKKWIAEREQCASTANETEDLVSCVDAQIHQRSDFLRKEIQERNIEKRLSEFAKFKLKTFKDAAFEFQYPNSWHLETTVGGRISLKSGSEEIILGFAKTLTSPKQCTYSEQGSSEDEIRRSFYEGKRQIGGQEFSSFHRSWLPSGEERHYYAFFNGRCFAIDVSDNSEAQSNCGRIDDGKERARCKIAELEVKDLMTYSNGIIKTLRFSSDQSGASIHQPAVSTAR
jgi:uncharacterized protein